METSAKSSQNVNELFHEIGKLQILSGRNEEQYDLIASILILGCSPAKFNVSNKSTI